MALDKLAVAVRKLHEEVMGTPIHFGRKPNEAIKRAVDPSHPTEPIEGTEPISPADPAGQHVAKPTFQAMVEVATAALLDHKDPHEAVEALLGEGEMEGEAEIVRAVEAALDTLEIEVKEPEAEQAPPDTDQG